MVEFGQQMVTDIQNMQNITFFRNLKCKVIMMFPQVSTVSGFDGHRAKH